MGERTDARRSIEASRARMTEIAEELSWRSSPAYVKSRAREEAMRRATQAREQAVQNPGVLGAIGALAGGALGVMLARKGRQRHLQQRYGYAAYQGGFRTEPSWVSAEYAPGYVPRDETGTGPAYSAAPEAGAAGAFAEPYRSETAERAWSEGEAPQEGTWPGAEQPRGAEATRGGPSIAWAPEPTGYAGAREGYEREEGRAAEFKETAAHLKGRATEVASGLRGRAAHLASEWKERAGHTASELRHKFEEKRSEGPSLGERAHGMREKIPSGEELRHTAHERPFGVLLGGILLGAAAAALLPLTRKERKVMHPAHEKARQQFGERLHSLEERIGVGGGGEGRAERPEGGFEEPFRQPQRFSQTRGAEGGTRGAAGPATREDEAYRQPSVGTIVEQAEETENPPEGGGSTFH